MTTLGIHHLGLATSDLEAITGCFVDCLGWSPLAVSKPGLCKAAPLLAVLRDIAPCST